MDLIEAIRHRRSVRKFQSRPVPPELLECLIEAAGWAPSASNRQDWEFVVVTAPELKTRMAAVVDKKWQELLAKADSDILHEAVGPYAKNFDWFAAAPVVIAITCKPPESFLQHLLGSAAAEIAGCRTSAAMAAQNLLLAAYAAGLGGCCLTGPVAAIDELRPLLELGRRRELVCLIALGYPAETPKAPSRKPAEEIMRTMGVKE